MLVDSLGSFCMGCFHHLTLLTTFAAQLLCQSAIPCQVGFGRLQCIFHSATAYALSQTGQIEKNTFGYGCVWHGLEFKRIGGLSFCICQFSSFRKEPSSFIFLRLKSSAVALEEASLLTSWKYALRRRAWSLATDLADAYASLTAGPTLHFSF